MSETARANIRITGFPIAGGLPTLHAGVIWFWPVDGAWRSQPGAITLDFAWELLELAF
ncbi:hypothetical protein [Novosphingobium sp.]|uniref:hypothetical protein n=1 Tax=Novosphingobium sp. TaxID=1874826 RepID=UPI003BACBF4A